MAAHRPISLNQMHTGLFRRAVHLRQCLQVCPLPVRSFRQEGPDLGGHRLRAGVETRLLQEEALRHRGADLCLRVADRLRRVGDCILRKEIRQSREAGPRLREETRRRQEAGPRLREEIRQSREGDRMADRPRRAAGRLRRVVDLRPRDIVHQLQGASQRRQEAGHPYQTVEHQEAGDAGVVGRLRAEGARAGRRDLNNNNNSNRPWP